MLLEFGSHNQREKGRGILQVPAASSTPIDGDWKKWGKQEAHCYLCVGGKGHEREHRFKIFQVAQGYHDEVFSEVRAILAQIFLTQDQFSTQIWEDIN
jgi:hypothetical protein